MKPWEIEMIADSGYRHGQAYALGNIYRSCGRFFFKKPAWFGMDSWAAKKPFEDHKFLENVYIHAFRQGLKQSKKEI